jgi:tellurite resistance protein TerC
MSAFAVPKVYQHRVLLVGVLIALVLRATLILAGAAAIQRFTVTFYLFGLLLVITAIGLFRRQEDDEDANPGNNLVVRTVARLFPTTTRYDGAKLTTVEMGRRKATPMLLVMLAIGTTDILFALDSIPAIFGLTQEAFLVFTANAFALMGLRQLYFLVAGLLERLVFLSYGLALILLFIGVKLILHALHETTTLGVPEISIGLSLVFIFSVLLVTTVVSLLYVRRHPGLVTAPGGLDSREADAHRRAAASREGAAPSSSVDDGDVPGLAAEDGAPIAEDR